MGDIIEMQPMDAIEEKAEDYSVARDLLEMELRSMNEALELVRLRYLPELKKRAAATRRELAALQALIEANPELFKRPRTVEVHGVKLGYRSLPRKVAPGPNTVALIEKHCPEKVETMIEVTKKPISSTLQKLSPGERQKLGCVVTGGGDAILIKHSTDSLEKLLKKILEEPFTELDE